MKKTAIPLLILLAACGTDNAPPALHGDNPTSTGPAPVAATGQTKCYDASGVERDCAGTGEDGELQKGVRQPSPRFTDNGDGTVTDNLTGLVWMKEANCIGNRLPHLDSDANADGAVTWQHGLDFIAGINYGAHDCGQSGNYTDWRMPNYNEIRSLINAAYYNPAISNAAGNGQWTSGDPFTGLHQTESGDVFWTSDSVPSSENNAIRINLASGAIINMITSPKTGTALVWPVRGGN